MNFFKNLITNFKNLITNLTGIIYLEGGKFLVYFKNISVLIIALREENKSF